MCATSGVTEGSTVEVGMLVSLGSGKVGVYVGLSDGVGDMSECVCVKVAVLSGVCVKVSLGTGISVFVETGVFVGSQATPSDCADTVNMSMIILSKTSFFI